MHLPIAKATYDRSGLALVLCFIVLLAMFAIAVPFLGSMNLYARGSATMEARVRAKHDARSIAALAVVHLRKGQTVAEHYAVANPRQLQSVLDPFNNNVVPFNTPGYDGDVEIGAGYYLSELLEWQVQGQGQGNTNNVVPALNVTDPQGRLWSVTVEDEQGKVNLDTASPWLLANLIAPMSVVSITPSTTQAGTLVAAAPVSSDIDLQRLVDPNGGYVWVAGELIAYARALGNYRSNPPTITFSQLVRGVTADPAAGQYEYMPAIDHVPGTPVVPAIAYKMFRHAYDPGRLQQNANRPAVFRDIASIRRLADQTKFTDPAQLRPWDGGRCETLDAEMFDAIKDHLTIHSTARFNNQTGGAFANPHILRNNLPGNPAAPQVLSLDANRGIQPGSVLRIRDDAGVFTYCIALAVNGNTVVIDRRVSSSVGANRAIVEVLDRHPININTATRRVLIAALANLYNVGSSDTVSMAEAIQVADAIITRVHDPYSATPNPQPFQDFADFSQWLNSEVSARNISLSSGLDLTAILTNARYPVDPTSPLPAAPTAPFCYQSFDTFTLAVTATWHNDAGVPESRFALRQLRDIGGGNRTATWDSLTEIFLNAPMNTGQWLQIQNLTLGGQAQPMVELEYKQGFTPPANPGNNYRAYDYDLDIQGQGQLTVYLQTGQASSQEPNATAQGRTVQAGQPLQLDMSNFGAAGGGVDLSAGSLGFWVRPQTIDTQNFTYFYDQHGAGEPPQTNRFAVMYDQRRDALVMRFADASLEPFVHDLVYRLQPTATPLGPDAVSPIPGIGRGMRPGVWYHINCTWKGQSFNDLHSGGNPPVPIPPRMNVLIDGLGATPLNRTHSYSTITAIDPATGEAVLEIGSTLAQPLPTAPTAPAPPVDPMNPTPAEVTAWTNYAASVTTAREIYLRPGGGAGFAALLAASANGRIAIDIGGECVEVNQVNGDVLTGSLVTIISNPFLQVPGVTRGARGTNANAHVTNTRVLPWGYNVELEAATPTGNPAAPSTPINAIPAVQGVASADFEGNTFRTIQSLQVADPQYQNSTMQGPDAGLQGAGATPQATHILVAPDATPGATPIIDFPERGYVLVYGPAWLPGDYVTQPNPTPPPATVDIPNWISGSATTFCGEIIYYDAKVGGLTDAAGNACSGLRIAQRNAIPWNGPNPVPAPAHFASGSTVTLISFELSDSANYAPNNGFVFLYDGGFGGGSGECVRYTDIDTTYGNHFIWNSTTATLIPAWRAQIGTGPRVHTAGITRGVPIFRINHGRSEQAGFQSIPSASRGDLVTAVEGRNSNKAMTGLNGNLRIAWTSGSGASGLPGNARWAALNDFVAAPYVLGGGTRLLKFPTGEMPIGLPVNGSFGGQTPGNPGSFGTACIIDEIESNGLGAGNFRLAVDLTNLASDTQVFVTGAGGMNPSVGVIRLDDELIAYRGITTVGGGISSLDNCTRGALGTPITAHAAGTLFLNMANLKVGLLNGALPNNAGSQFTLNGVQNQFDPIGFAMVVPDTQAGNSTLATFNLEAIGYIREPNGSFRVSMYSPQNRGLFRGRFGTSVQNHTGVGGFAPIILGMPYRYIDRFCDPLTTMTSANPPQPLVPGAVFVNSPEQHTVGGAMPAKNGSFPTVRWTIVDSPEFLLPVTNAPPTTYRDYVAIVLYVKTSSTPSWDDPTVQRYVFDVANAAPSTLGSIAALQQTDTLQGVTGDYIEWRVGITFTNNAYRFDAWKWSPQLLGVEFDWQQPNDRLLDSYEVPR